jgi:phenylacetate-CoA ligase
MVSDKTLALFHKAAAGIPAYKSYLSANGIDPSVITDGNAFLSVPLTSKKGYLVHHPLQDLIWSDADNPILFCSTSGSTGEPYYFPRDEKLSWQYSFLLEDYIKASSYGKGKTLVLIGFGMGVWIGGVITLRAFEIAAARMDQQIALLPTGYNKTEIYKALKRLSPQFDQTIIVGYPPFVKEVVDEADGEGVKLQDLHIRFLFAAESFSETFRNYVCEKAGVSDPVRDTLNIYGTADIGAMAYETPLSILIRRIALEDPMLYRDLFGQIHKTPTLAQYDPRFIEFEEVEGEVVLNADGVLPLVRYAVGDHGGVLDYAHIRTVMAHYGVNLEAEISKAKLGPYIDKKKPFVYVYERVDFSVTIHGIIIYPEFVKEALLKPEMSDHFTERFTMATKTDIHHNQFLQINIELQKGVAASAELERKALKKIKASLIERSSEFAEISKSNKAGKLIHCILWENGHPRYFAPGTKQKWVEKK